MFHVGVEVHVHVHVRTEVSYVYAMIGTFIGRMKYKRKVFFTVYISVSIFKDVVYTTLLLLNSSIVLCSEIFLQNYPNLTTETLLTT